MNERPRVADKSAPGNAAKAEGMRESCFYDKQKTRSKLFLVKVTAFLMRKNISNRPLIIASLFNEKLSFILLFGRIDRTIGESF